MRILYGPPGTGKTWLAAREAVGTVLPDEYFKWRNGNLSDEGLLDLHQKLVLEGRIKWVTFHPSYSYEDFVEGFRPTKSASEDKVLFEVRKGPFRDICDIAMGHRITFGPSVGAEIAAIGGSKKYVVIGANDQGWLLSVRPNRSDQVGEEQEKFVTRRVIERAVDLGLEPKVFSIPGKAEVLPSKYGLEGNSTVVGSELRRRVGELLGISSSDLANSAHFGAVAAFVKKRELTAPKPQSACLVIDEINRADLSRVFGELITLLEPDKRLGADEERRVHLPYSGEERFGVPSTLSIIGTMNTADRSITSMDFAMRRRFTFSEVAPDPAFCPVEYGGMRVSDALQGLNRRIEVLRGRDYRLGHATLMKMALDDTRSSFGWADDTTGKRQALAYVFRTRVVPLLQEYFHEDFRKVEIALGIRNRRFGSSERPLFVLESLSPSEQEIFADVFDTDGLMLGEPASWWNPEAPDQFDGDAFAEAIAAMA